MNLIESRLELKARLPRPRQFGERAFLIYDRRLLKIAGVREWIAGFPAAWGVVSGENLKSAERFPSAVARLTRVAGGWPAREITVVACGGGTIGDFGGFLASVFKRGVRLIHAPSTWLAALDSAHGGKTALNAGGYKNQIGTFYSAERTVICRDLLRAQPPARAREGLGELAKIALLDGGDWTRTLRVREGREGPTIWAALPAAIEAKMRVVRQDPFERSGLRQILNLGHTLGHALESELGLAHGAAVAEGLRFALDWSLERRILSRAGFAACDELLRGRCGLNSEYLGQKRIREARLRAALARDKKSVHDGLTFIFLEAIGAPLRRVVSIDEVVREARRGGWTR